MKFAVVKDGTDRLRDSIADEVIRKFVENGAQLTDDPSEVHFVLNLADTGHTKPYHRRSKDVFVITIGSAPNLNGQLRAFCYTTLIRSLSNLCICAVGADAFANDRNGGIPECYFTTPEAGYYHYPFDPERVYRSILPIASAHFASENIMTADLPKQYWESSPVVEEIRKYAAELNDLGVLPAPFPLRELLPTEEMEHLYRLFGMTGLSYGNMSARERIPELGSYTYWMTGRGVNKSALTKVGKDILLVKEFDFDKGAAIVSVPPGYDPRARVSVDAVEHAMIYKTFPEVGAILHVHAWMKDIVCTHQNFPCGTVEIAGEVSQLLSKTRTPARAAIGLKNHGITVTGESLEDIFSRLHGRLLTEVPAFA